jgi:sugar phosphate isomerase/epimerase
MFMTAPLDFCGLRHCFSTLGCADLSFPEICQLAAEFSVPGIELRGIGGRMDMPEYCAEQSLTPARVTRISGQNHTQTVVAGSSIKLTSASEKDRAEFVAFCTWADALQIPYVRVFGGGTWGTPLSDADYAHAAGFIQWWRKEKSDRLWQVELLMETHDAFSASSPCLRLNQLLPKPLHLIWDSHHTWRLGGESPEHTWSLLAPLVRHVHVKDSVDRPSARHPYTYVLPGEGQMPLREVMAPLQKDGFKGFVSLEWERFWHPYLPSLREALAVMQRRMWFAPPVLEIVEPVTQGATAAARRLT